MEKPDANCADNCIYTKVGVDGVPESGVDYCFTEVDLADSANVVCEAISSTDFTTITTILSSISTTVPVAAKPTTSMPTTTTTMPPTTTTTIPPLNVVQQQAQEKVEEKITHEKNLTDTEGEVKKAEDLTTHLDNARKKIDEIVNGTSRRTIRQINSCSDIISHVQKIDEAVIQENYTKASELALEIIETEVTCNTEEKEQLKSQQEKVTEVKEKLEGKITKKVEEITELKIKINGLINDLAWISSCCPTMVTSRSSE